MAESNGIDHVEISRADDDRLRVKLTVGSFPGPVLPPFGKYESEGVEISVLVDIPATHRYSPYRLPLWNARRE